MMTKTAKEAVAKPRQSVDWEAIERAYRAGILSIRAIADKHGTRESTIRSRAKKYGWQRDLTDQVKTATKAKLSRKASRNDIAHANPRDDAQIVDEASSEAADVVLAHRVDLAQWRAISQKLCVALSEMEVDEENHDRFARSLNAGVDAQLKVIKGERQAYSLDEPDSGDDEPSRVEKVEISIVGQDATDQGDEATS